MNPNENNKDSSIDAAAPNPENQAPQDIQPEVTPDTSTQPITPETPPATAPNGEKATSYETQQAPITDATAQDAVGSLSETQQASGATQPESVVTPGMAGQTIQQNATNPETSLNTEPTISQTAATTEATQPVVPSPQAPIEEPSAPQADAPKISSIKKRLPFLLIPAFVLIIAVGILVAMQVFSGGLKLETYSNDDFSIKYPSGYEEQTEDLAVVFTEPGEENDETLSGVIVAVEEFTDEVSQEDRESLAKNIEEQVDAFIDTAAISSDQEIRNRRAEDTKIGEYDARRVTAEIFSNDQKAGTFYVTGGVADNKVVLVAVLAHASDPSVEEKALEILDSFELKN